MPYTPSAIFVCWFSGYNSTRCLYLSFVVSRHWVQIDGALAIGVDPWSVRAA